MLRLLVWFGFVLLALLGTVAAIARLLAIATNQPAFAILHSLFPPAAVREALDFDRWFAAHAALTVCHVVCGGIVLVLAPFQFSTRVRQRHARFHRRSGRFLLLAVVPAASTGLALGALSPHEDLAARFAVALFGMIFLVAAGRAFLAVRRYDFITHREWMIRMVAIGVGIATVRIVGLALSFIAHATPLQLIGESFWLGLGLTFLAGEAWIRYTRHRRGPDVLASSGGRSVPSNSQTWARVPARSELP